MMLRQAVASCIKKTFVFRGRTPRMEFLQFCLGYLPIAALLVFLAAKVSDLIGLIAAFAFMVPMVAAGYRRLHDTGLEGYLIFFPLIVLPLSILLLTTPLSIEVSGTQIFGLDLRRSMFWVLVAVLHAIIAVLIGVRLLFPSDPNKNFFGPNPNEVST